MDRVWYEQKLNNSKLLSEQPIGRYYSHPVWLMNGIFSSCDLASLKHRESIAEHLNDLGAKNIADYGGGFGQLSLSIASLIKDANVSIIEPYPSKVGIERLKNISQIKMISDLKSDEYDAIIVQDVLEHVDDPIKLAFDISKLIHQEGYMIVANCFYPTIQSHIPSTFHLRHMFIFVMQALGLKYIGPVPGANHAQVFQRIGDYNFEKARKAETLSKFIGPKINLIRKILAYIKKYILRA